jgi:adenine-specific DNA-methyltransferase
MEKIFSLATDPDSIILDGFAGSGSSAQAVLALNRDGGNRKFILIEQEDYADTLTAERVRRVIKGVKGAGSDILRNGTGGSFSYFELGPAIQGESIAPESSVGDCPETAG